MDTIDVMLQLLSYTKCDLGQLEKKISIFTQCSNVRGGGYTEHIGTVLHWGENHSGSIPLQMISEKLPWGWAAPYATNNFC